MNWILTLKYIACGFVLLFATVARGESPIAIATYHSLGLYWTPEQNTSNADVLVRYRVQGAATWREALPMQYREIAGTTNELAPYRGSIVHLQPGTTYEVDMRVEGTGVSERLIASTWREDYPVGVSVAVPDQTTQFNITESGTADAYRVYDGTGSTIDVGNAEAHTLTIDASYVVIRGFNLKGAATHGIRILGGHDIIIEDCDISDWGKIDFDGDYGQNMQSAIFSTNEAIARVTVQRCKLHHPRHDSNSWGEFNCNSPNNCSYHSAGPQGIAFLNSAGNHVLRYNEIWSDADHYYNDILGFGNNGSFEGFPGPDSDIYGNYLANCWDDGIEAEGGGRNVRIWSNYVENCFMALANAATSIGPLYVWRNVSGPCHAVDYAERGRDVQGNFLKMGYASSEDWMTGHAYIFHNTILNGADDGCNGLGGSSRIIKHTTTRNNVFHVRSTDSHSIADSPSAIDNDFDHDLYSHQVPAGAEVGGVQGVPVFTLDSQWQPGERVGRFQLERGSPGFDAGVLIPNFNDQSRGNGPDMGAHETGWPAVQYGTKASMPRPDEPSLLRISDLAVEEGVGIAKINVELSPASTAPVTVLAHTFQTESATPGVDYYGDTVELTFAAGETKKIFDVIIRDDVRVEEDETIGVRLAQAQGAEITSARALLTILDDDTEGAVSVLSVEDQTVSEAAGVASITVSLEPVSELPVEVIVFTRPTGSAQPGQDYYGKTETLSFSPGESSGSFDIDIVNDTEVDPFETFDVILLNATNGAWIDDSDATITVEDDD